MTTQQPLSSRPHLGQVPDKVTADGLEDKWGGRWEDAGTYSFDRTATREQVYSIDTPPPTVSGSLHVGHVFSYTHTDVVARYQRMMGKEVFYPMGWDDNGLPTERRVQNYFGVRVDTSLPYDPDFQPPHTGGGKSIKARDQQPTSRQNFVELCERLSIDDEKQFEALWRRLGLSVDWKQHYQTIGAHARKVAQAAFLRNLARGEAYQQEAPGLWDITFQTAVAQAELESREYPGFYHRLAFHITDEGAARQAAEQGAPVENGRDVYIETTRPELLAACVALIAHPDDERFKPLFGTTVTSPVFGVEVPVLAHPEAEMDKGAGIAMCCTFGDTTDIDWWRDLDLPLRAILRKDGRIATDVPEWITDPAGRQAYEAMAGKTTFSARQEVVDRLRESGEMSGEPTPTQRQTNFFERGEKPLEIVTSRQWYIRNGGRPWTHESTGKDFNDELIERGHALDFHPEFMRVRYENWVGGLNNDWLISRQRFFGVPFPLWYRIDEDGTTLYDQLIIPDEADLPIDPSSDTPHGYTEDQRDQPGGFAAELDIMDTWATSSLSPQIAAGWLEDEDLFTRVYPMDLRPQGQDIIRTWLFSTVVRAALEFGELPWQHTALSGWIVDKDHKKMSKSKGNVVTPMGLLEKYGSDAVRYWAASARLGVDSAFDESQMKIGRRLAIKVLNASKFALTMGDDSGEVDLDASHVTQPLDQSVLAHLRSVIDTASSAFAAYDHARALEVTESFFWTFCDDYVELVKERAYNHDGAWSDEEAQSARATLALVINAAVRLLAPFLPYVTEEVWSWYQEGSIHRASWPTLDELSGPEGDPTVLDAASAALIVMRRVKSEAKVSPRTPFLAVTVQAPADMIPALEMVESDLRSATKVTGTLTLEESASTPDSGDDSHETHSVKVADVTLGEPPAKRKK
ncbi:MAG: valine--tRNA ligase [Actinomycetaceae bacterium]|nr:valine--tRNA ligase [Actinomycetaceae bacterium]